MFFISLLFFVWADVSADSPTTVKGATLDPDAHVFIRTPRGSLQENQLFEKTFLDIPLSSTSPFLTPEAPGIYILTPQGSEIIKALPITPAKGGVRSGVGMGDSPSYSGQDPKSLIPAPLPKTGPLRQPPEPWTHGRRYILKTDADVEVFILGPGRRPIHTHSLPQGDPGAKAGENEVILWEGKDPMGLTAPPGVYMAILKIKYPDGKEETQMFPLEQP